MNSSRKKQSNKKSKKGKKQEQEEQEKQTIVLDPLSESEDEQELPPEKESLSTLHLIGLGGKEDWEKTEEELQQEAQQTTEFLSSASRNLIDGLLERKAKRDREKEQSEPKHHPQEQKKSDRRNQRLKREREFLATVENEMKKVDELKSGKIAPDEDDSALEETPVKKQKVSGLEDVDDEDDEWESTQLTSLDASMEDALLASQSQNNLNASNSEIEIKITPTKSSTTEEKPPTKSPKKKRKVSPRKTKLELSLEMNTHKLKLLILYAQAAKLNELANDELLQHLTLSLFPYSFHKSYKPKKSKYVQLDENEEPETISVFYQLKSLMKYFYETFKIQNNQKEIGVEHAFLIKPQTLIDAVQNKKITNHVEANIILLAAMRSLGYAARMVVHLDPSIQEERFNKKKEKQKKSTKEAKSKKKETKSKSSSKSKSSTAIVSSKASSSSTTSSKTKKKNTSPSKESSSVDTNENREELWVEVYSPMEDNWIQIDCTTQQLNILELCKKADSPSPVQYPSFYVALGSNQYAIDVTFRYKYQVAQKGVTSADQFEAICQWFDELLAMQSKKALRQVTQQNDECVLLELSEEEVSIIRKELHEFDKVKRELLLKLPKYQDAYRYHPLYVIEKYIGKYEALYPPDPPSVGTVGKFPIYQREYLKTLHSKDRWLREGRVVREGEKAYKIVKSNSVSAQASCELYGDWQTDAYKRPVAKDGIVPKNERGVVDLWHEGFLPEGCVHLKLKGLSKIAKKLSIDYAKCMVGFDVRHKRSVPMFDGIVVCKEYETILREAFVQSEQIRYKKLKEKRLFRVLANWKKLALRLLAREKVKAKYGDENSLRGVTDLNYEETDEVMQYQKEEEHMAEEEVEQELKPLRFQYNHMEFESDDSSSEDDDDDSSDEEATATNNYAPDVMQDEEEEEQTTEVGASQSEQKTPTPTQGKIKYQRINGVLMQVEDF